MSATARLKSDPKAPGAEPAGPNGAEAQASPDQPAPPRRSRGRYALMLALPLALAAGGGYAWLAGGRYQTTENAYLQQAKVQMTSEASGRVVEVAIADNVRVAAGDVLFRLDSEPYRIALEQADAALAAARIDVEQLRAAYSAAVARQGSAASEVAYLEREFERQQALSDRGVNAASALDAADRDLRTARDDLSAADQAVVGALAALNGDANIAAEAHPAVMAAQAARDEAAYELAQTEVRAPAAGTISQAGSFKLGQFVAAGTPLFALVETDDAWVEANFKETQLTHLMQGQTATVVFDTYPDRPVTATVDSIGAGTGAAFALLPAQNATGNWVKVSQRVPVRLRLSAEASDLALRTGMSAEVVVDTEVQRSLAGLVGGVAHAAN